MKTSAIFFTFVAFLLLWQCQHSDQNDGSKKEEQSEQSDKANTRKEISTAESLKKSGKSIVKASGQALIGKLSKAIGQGGIDHAIEFCSHNATAITDSLSEVHDAKVSRVSHKNRNPNNAADSLEMALVSKYQAKNQANKPLKPEIMKRGDKKVYYHPITIKSGLCLNCHGEKGKDIKVADYIVIQNQYPNDKAIGFEMGELRGLWKVQFEQGAI